MLEDPTADEFEGRIARLEGLLDIPTAEGALREAEKWVAQGETRFARLALIRAKSIQARTMLHGEIADDGLEDAGPRGHLAAQAADASVHEADQPAEDPADPDPSRG